MNLGGKLLAAFLACIVSSVMPLKADSGATARAPAHADATAAIPKQDDGRFLRRHRDFLERGKAGPVGLLFLGDSITEAWISVPELWGKYYGAHAPANFGVGGNRTQNVIWQIENGELRGISPKVIVLLIGTNNAFTHTGEEIAAGVKKIISLVQAQLPRTKVLLLAIFPRGPRRNKDGTFDDSLHRMAVIRVANREMARLADGDRVRFLDIGASFGGKDGEIPDAIMPDQLHLSPAGYQLWADAMQPTLTELLTR